MKMALLAATLLGLLVLGIQEVQAQAYVPYGVYWDGSQYVYAQQNDPYYELHVLHYQLYLPQYQPYPIYQPCCFIGSFIIPGAPALTSPASRAIVTPRRQAIRRR
jgi:hypothetical protein